MTSINIPKSVTNLSHRAFANTALTFVVIPEGVTSIGTNAFLNCDKLKAINIPKSITNIYNGAFLGCDNLTDVYYNGTKAQWDAIDILSDNNNLTNAIIHYESEA